MKQVLISQGQVDVEEIPAPQVQPGMVLVRVAYSCISAGTEMSGVKASGQPLWKKAIRRPDKVVKVLARIATQGLARTKNQIQGNLSAGLPSGYSASGRVMEVGSEIDDLDVGVRVACAGAQFAHHAEVIAVPRNLVVPVPDEVDLSHASVTTLGAIALQGVRRASPTLGETFVVLGLGILGQITLQLLKANGSRVVGVDLDRGRLELGRQLGMDVGVHPDDGDNIEEVIRLTDANGADGVIITAASPSDRIVSTAFSMCRRKGRVVLVGDVGLKLNRADFYSKELNFLISCSYGPGRYDRNYEEEGLDYPIAFVRWTENRNMAEFVRLLAEKRLNIEPLISNKHPIDKADQAFESLKNPEKRPLIVLLQYPERSDAECLKRRMENKLAGPVEAGPIRLALIGASGFTKATHIPNLSTMKDRFQIQAVMSRTGTNAHSTARHCGAKYATTDAQEIFNDPEVDAVLIATRHDSHASLALSALKAGKHVLVEKPLAIEQEGLDAITNFYDQNSNGKDQPILMTGFNRRFSPAARHLKNLLSEHTNPIILNYRMNAGRIPREHWIQGKDGGGRNIGEACHIYDLFTYLLDARITEVHAASVTPKTQFYMRNDNFTATLRFVDGSIATLTYSAMGNQDYPKEQLEVFVDDHVFTLVEYQQVTAYGMKEKNLLLSNIDKGHCSEFVSFSEAIKEGSWPIPLWQQVQSTKISFEVEQKLQVNR